nr:PD-(D/E)XK nuclease domain-containing protein [uncultured Schaedlerella sp.]
MRGEKSYAAETKEWYNGYHFDDFDVNDKYETLLAGGYIVEPIEENLTYDVLEGSEENLWSLLYLTELFSDLLFDTISYHDYAESFYLAFLTGLFYNAGYRVESNYENGLGRSDIVIKDRKNRRAFVLEAKRTYDEDKLESDCEEALAQTQKKRYAEKAERDGYKNVGRLGIAFFQKKCLVKKM